MVRDRKKRCTEVWGSCCLFALAEPFIIWAPEKRKQCETPAAFILVFLGELLIFILVSVNLEKQHCL